MSPCFVKFSNNVPQARTQTMQIRSGRRQRLKEYDNYMASKSCRLFYEELWHCGSREAERPPCHTSAQSVCWKHGSLSALSCRPSAIASLLCRLGWKKTAFERMALCIICTQHCDTYSSAICSPSEQDSGEERPMRTPQCTLQCKLIAHKT